MPPFRLGLGLGAGFGSGFGLGSGSGLGLGLGFRFGLGLRLGLGLGHLTELWRGAGGVGHEQHGVRLTYADFGPLGSRWVGLVQHLGEG